MIVLLYDCVFYDSLSNHLVFVKTGRCKGKGHTKVLKSVSFR